MRYFKLCIFALATLLIYLAVLAFSEDFSSLVVFNIAYLLGGFSGVLWGIILEYI